MEGADEVLAAGVVHADLAADGAVDLRHHGRRHVHERDAAEVRGGREAHHVAEHAAAHRHDRRAAIGAAIDQRVVHAGDGSEVLRAFAVRDEDRRHPAEPAADGGPDAWTRDVDGLAGELRRGQFGGQPPREAAVDDDAIAAVAGRDIDGGRHTEQGRRARMVG